MTVSELIVALAAFPPEAVIASTSEMDGCLQSTEPDLCYALLSISGNPIILSDKDRPGAHPIVRF